MLKRSFRVVRLPLRIIVGGFFGDEGKGKIASYLGITDNPAIAVRTGAINAGHTVVYNGSKFKLRITPSSFINKNVRLMVAAGALIRFDVLFKELNELGVKGRLFLDYNTGVIEEKHVEAERRDSILTGKIGSTLQGVGAAMCDRVLRRLKLARDFKELSGMLTSVSEEVNEALEKDLEVHLEGTQGLFLSLYHGTYPYVTSRDTTASAVASEVGVGPKVVDDVIVVFKSYVTRVGGGPLEGELSEEEIRKRGWVEIATVTGRVRRAAPFNVKMARKAVVVNSATQVAITNIDKLFPEARGIREWSKLPMKARRWVEDVESKLKTPVTLIGTGPDVKEIIDRRKDFGLI